MNHAVEPVDLQVPPPFGVIAAASGILLAGPGFTPGEGPTVADVATAAATTNPESNRIAIELEPGAPGWIAIHVPQAHQFAVHYLGGMLISWAHSPLEGATTASVTFERVGTVFENRAWFEIHSLEMLKHKPAANGDPDVTRAAIRDSATAGARAFANDVVAIGLGDVSYGTDDVFAVVQGGAHVGVFIASNLADPEYPPRDAIACRPAPEYSSGDEIAPGAFSLVDLRGRDFSGWDLRGVDFGKSDLRGAVFADADLRGAQFYRVRADDAVFDRARLEESDWSLAFAPRTSFVDADLTGARLEYAQLERTVFRGATLRDAVLDGATVLNSDWQRVDLTGATVGDGATVCDTDLSRAVVNDADFEDCDLRGSDLSGVDLSSASFDGAVMPEGTDDD